MTIAATRVLHTAEGIGPKIPTTIIADLVKKKATHISFHSNQIISLEIAVRMTTSHHSRYKEAIDIVKKENCLEYVLELDLSSNRLHDGCELSHYQCPTRHSLLSMTSRLIQLNLSSNGLTEKSFRTLICVEKPNGSSIPLLPHLRSLDLSFNNVSCLPIDLQKLCPSLSYFVGTGNKLKSLTTLLQTLNNFRGRLQSIQLFNRKSSKNNPICCKRLYREKLVFILGSNLKFLDGIKITDAERDSIRCKLGHDYQIEVEIPNDRRKHEMPVEHSYMKSKESLEYSDDSFDVPQNCQENDNECVQCHMTGAEDDKIQQISNLELQVSSLSALVETQTRLTNNLLQASQDCRRSNESEDKKEASTADESRTDIVEPQTRQHSDNVVNRQRLEIARAVLKILLIERKRKRECLFHAFYRWISFVRFVDLSNKMKRKIDVVKLKYAAVRKDIEQMKTKLSLSIKSERIAHSKTSELSARVQDMENKLQIAQEEHRKEIQNSSKSIGDLQTTIRTQNAASNVKDEEHSRLVQRLETALKSSASELRCTKEELETEKSKRISIESAKQLASQEAADTMTSRMVELEDLKLQVIQKNATIKQLKDAFEQFATNAAADRSKAEHASLAERQANELLQEQNRKMSGLEAEIYQLQSTVASHNDRSTEMRQEIDDKVSTIAELQLEIGKLTSVVSEKTNWTDELARKIKLATDGQAELNGHLKECKQSNLRLKKRNNQLQTQLNGIYDELRTTKDSTVPIDLLHAEKAKVVDLQSVLDESKNRESELHFFITKIQCEKSSFHKTSSHQESLIKSLEKKLQKAQTNWKYKESQLRSQHGLQIEETKRNLEREVISLKNALDTERSLRLEADAKFRALESSGREQKTKMQSAIEGLTKQLTALA